MHLFHGSLVALITPFKDGKLDEAALEKMVEWHVQNGTNAIVPTGTTGECPTLTVEEHIRVIKTTVDVAAGRVPVMAGAGSNNPVEAVHFSQEAEKAGADGLLHISEMSWGRIENPKKVFKSGETVKVMIKDINDDKIALTRKFPEENPWADAATAFAVGNVVKGKVARMTDFGAFVELRPGVDALLHVSQISNERVEKPSDVLHIGDEIEAKVTDFNEADKKISLSIKALNAPKKEEVKDEDVAVAYTDTDEETEEQSEE